MAVIEVILRMWYIGTAGDCWMYGVKSKDIDAGVLIIPKRTGFTPRKVITVTVTQEVEK